MLYLSHFEKLLQEVLSTFNVDITVLGGGEPTIDTNLFQVVKVLKKYGLEIRLLTNAYLLSNKYIDKLLKHGFSKTDDIIVVSLKVINPVKHRLITGVDNSIILNNVENMYNKGLNIIIETVYVPELITIKDVVNLAKWISKNLKSEITLIIDPYIPVPNLPFRKPTIEELNTLTKYVKEYLSNVICRQLSTKQDYYGGYVLHKGVKIGL